MMQRVEVAHQQGETPAAAHIIHTLSTRSAYCIIVIATCLLMARFSLFLLHRDLSSRDSALKACSRTFDRPHKNYS